MPSVVCAVVGCANGTYRLQKWKQNLCDVHGHLKGTGRCVCEQPFVLHPFPTERKDPEARKEWIKKLQRIDIISKKNWQPKWYDRVCSEHFVEGRPSERNPYPALKLGYTESLRSEGRRSIVKHEPVPKKRKVSFTVSKSNGQEAMHCDEDTMIHDRSDVPVVTEQLLSPSTGTSTDAPSAPEPCPPVSLDSDSPLRIEAEPRVLNFDHDYSSPFACDCPTRNHCEGCHKKLQELQEQNHLISTLERRIQNLKPSCESLLTDDKAVRFYTGLPNKATFELLFEYTHPKVENMQYWRGPKLSKSMPEVSPNKKRGPKRKMQQKDELLLTLMRLRLGLLNELVARQFDISEATASSIFTTWVKVIAQVLSPSLTLPPPECIKANLPKCFSGKYSKLRGIMDCTEFFIERPKDLRVQAQTYSDYKKHNTIKVLVVITPRGRIGFLSNAWGGRASDRHIVLNSGFLDKIQPYDLYMADRGFNIESDLLMKRAQLVIPPGARGKEQMSEKDVKKTKEVANLRIHVERAIERIKRFRILKFTLPITLLSLSDDILQACAGLCNLLEPLVK